MYVCAFEKYCTESGYIPCTVLAFRLFFVHLGHSPLIFFSTISGCICATPFIIRTFLGNICSVIRMSIKVFKQ